MKINILASPPTGPTLRKVDLRYRIGFALTGSVPIGLLIAAIGFMSTDAGSTYYVAMAALLGTAVFCLLMGDFAQSPYQPITSSDCDAMLELCLTTPEGFAYRRAVIAQEREFVKAELQALDAWTKKLKESARHRALYDPDAPAKGPAFFDSPKP